jgi:hypothetical protein
MPAHAVPGHVAVAVLNGARDALVDAVYVDPHLAAPGRQMFDLVQVAQADQNQSYQLSTRFCAAAATAVCRSWTTSA